MRNWIVKRNHVLRLLLRVTRRLRRLRAARAVHRSDRRAFNLGASMLVLSFAAACQTSEQTGGQTAPPSPPPSPPPPPPRPAPPPTENGYRSPTAEPSRPRNGGTGAELPDFPWPPPQPSSRATLSPTRFTGDTTFGAVDDRISAALRAAEYSKSSYYRVPGGFAIVARLERIRDDARPAAPDQRFLPPNEAEDDNPLAFIHNLFFAPAGYYRQVVFVMTDKSFEASAPPPTADEAAALLKNGAPSLPASYRNKAVTPQHRVTALIYEFEKRGDEAATVRRPGGWEAMTHLDRAGLLTAMPQRP